MGFCLVIALSLLVLLDGSMGGVSMAKASGIDGVVKEDDVIPGGVDDNKEIPNFGERGRRMMERDEAMRRRLERMKDLKREELMRDLEDTPEGFEVCVPIVSSDGNPERARKDHCSHCTHIERNHRDMVDIRKQGVKSECLAESPLRCVDINHHSTCFVEKGAKNGDSRFRPLRDDIERKVDDETNEAMRRERMARMHHHSRRVYHDELRRARRAEEENREL